MLISWFSLDLTAIRSIYISVFDVRSLLGYQGANILKYVYTIYTRIIKKKSFFYVSILKISHIYHIFEYVIKNLQMKMKITAKNLSLCIISIWSSYKLMHVRSSPVTKLELTKKMQENDECPRKFIYDVFM